MIVPLDGAFLRLCCWYAHPSILATSWQGKGEWGEGGCTGRPHTCVSSQTRSLATAADFQSFYLRQCLRRDSILSLSNLPIPCPLCWDITRTALTSPTPSSSRACRIRPKKGRMMMATTKLRMSMAKKNPRTMLTTMTAFSRGFTITPGLVASS